MGHRSLSALVWIGAVLAAPIQAAERVEAEFVDATGDRLVLVRSGAESEVLEVEPGASLVGLASFAELRPGDRIAFSAGPGTRGVRPVTSLELLQMVTTDPEHRVEIEQIARSVGPGWDGAPTLVDLRSAAEFARGHLPGATSAPDWRSGLAARLPPDRGAAVVLYGQSRQDPAPVEALRACLRLGYANVRVLVGGYREWSDENRPTFIAARELARRIGSEPVVVLDVRPEGEVRSGSLPRSVSVAPAAMRPGDWTERPTMPVLVLAGRDGEDPAPLEVAERIRRWQPRTGSIPRGTIQVLEGGFAAWRAAGGAIEAARRSIEEVPCAALEGEICAAEFLRLWREAGGARGPLLLDVRPGASYRPAWAVHVALADLPERLAELPRDREILTFCSRGITSRFAQVILARAGYRARFVRLPAPAAP